MQHTYVSFTAGWKLGRVDGTAVGTGMEDANRASLPDSQHHMDKELISGRPT